MKRLRIVLALFLLTLVAAFATATAAQARDSLQAVASQLRSGSVYVDPGITNPAHTITADQATALSRQIADTQVATYVAVMTSETAGTTDPIAAAKSVNQAVGLTGVYAVVVDGFFRTSATGGRAARVAELATVSANAHPKDLPATLEDFVGRVGSEFGKGSGVATNPATTLVPLGIGAAVLGGGGLLLYRRSKQAAAERTAAVRRTLDEDVTSYGELVSGLDVDDPRLGADGSTEATQALQAYDNAKNASARMTRPEDAAAVTSALEEGRFAMARVNARITGTALPERRPPCFIDPRHGPSTTDVEWAPNGGAPRPVPVCAADALTLEQGGVPAAREVEVGGRRMPYWQAGGAYQPYANGYYASYGANLLPTILLGSMLGSGMGGGFFGGGGDGGSGGGGDAGGGGGDAGGGWGGDFGGGGGGDFGGGDF